MRVIMTAERKWVIIGVALFAVMSLVMFILFIGGKIHTSGYVPVMATVVDVIIKQDSDDSTTFGSAANYCAYEFSYGGKTYIIKKRVLMTIGKKEGGTANIRINPDNPAEFEDTFVSGSYFVIGGIASVATVALIVGLEQARYKPYEPYKPKRNKLTTKHR